MMGTPDLSSVYICREKSIRSTSVTGAAKSELFSTEPARRPAPAACWMSTGVMPVVRSWSATAPLSLPSILPLISSPRALRPRVSEVRRH